MKRIAPALTLFFLGPFVAEFLLGNLPITTLPAMIPGAGLLVALGGVLADMTIDGGVVDLEALFGVFPVALLERRPGEGTR